MTCLQWKTCRRINGQSQPIRQLSCGSSTLEAYIAYQLEKDHLFRNNIELAEE